MLRTSAAFGSEQPTKEEMLKEAAKVGLANFDEEFVTDLCNISEGGQLLPASQLRNQVARHLEQTEDGQSQSIFSGKKHISADLADSEYHYHRNIQSFLSEVDLSKFPGDSALGRAMSMLKLFSSVTRKKGTGFNDASAAQETARQLNEQMRLANSLTSEERKLLGLNSNVPNSQSTKPPQGALQPPKQEHEPKPLSIPQQRLDERNNSKSSTAVEQQDRGQSPNLRSGTKVEDVQSPNSQPAAEAKDNNQSSNTPSAVEQSARSQKDRLSKAAEPEQGEPKIGEERPGKSSGDLDCHTTNQRQEYCEQGNEHQSVDSEAANSEKTSRKSQEGADGSPAKKGQSEKQAESKSSDRPGAQQESNSSNSGGESSDTEGSCGSTTADSYTDDLDSANAEGQSAGCKLQNAGATEATETTETTGNSDEAEAEGSLGNFSEDSLSALQDAMSAFSEQIELTEPTSWSGGTAMRLEKLQIAENLAKGCQMRFMLDASRVLDKCSAVDVSKDERMEPDCNGRERRRRPMKSLSEIGKLAPQDLTLRSSNRTLFLYKAITGKFLVPEKLKRISKKQLIFMLADGSSSMKGEKHQKASGFVMNRLKAVAMGDAELWLSVFDVELKNVEHATNETEALELMRKYREGSFTGGGTNIASAVRAAHQHIVKLLDSGCQVWRPEIWVLTDDDASISAITATDIPGTRVHAVAFSSRNQALAEFARSTGGTAWENV
jgi:hypothetical protein